MQVIDLNGFRETERQINGGGVTDGCNFFAGSHVYTPEAAALPSLLPAPSLGGFPALP